MSKNKLLTQISLESEDHGQIGQHIAQEGIVDWFKDLFTSFFREGDLSSYRKRVRDIQNGAERLNEKPIIKYGSVPYEIALYPVRRGEFVKDLPKAIAADAANLKKFKDVIDTINDCLGKVESSDDDEAVGLKFDVERHITALNKLDNTHWLFNISIDVVKGNKIDFNSERLPVDVVISYPQTMDGETTIKANEDGTISMRDNAASSDAQRRKYKDYKVTMEKLKEAMDFDIRDFKQAAKELVDAYESLLPSMNQFVENFHRHRRHSSSKARAILRLGHNACLIPYYINRWHVDFYRSVR